MRYCFCFIIVVIDVVLHLGVVVVVEVVVLIVIMFVLPLSVHDFCCPFCFVDRFCLVCVCVCWFLGGGRSVNDCSIFWYILLCAVFFPQYNQVNHTISQVTLQTHKHIQTLHRKLYLHQGLHQGSL